MNKDKKNKEKLFQTDINYRIYRIKHFARKYRWSFMNDDGESFKFINKEYAILKIGYWNLNIETALSHPVWGDTILVRKGDFTMKTIESIFRNPRQHMQTEKIKSEYLK